MDITTEKAKVKKITPVTVVLLLGPLVLLAAVILLFLRTGGGLDLTAPVPIEDLTVERTRMAWGSIDIDLRNSGPERLQISQVVINDAIWPFELTQNPIPRLGKASLHLDYMWSEGEAYEISILTSSSIVFPVEIPVAFDTPQPDVNSFLGFGLIGLYVGVIPVYLGIFWFSALRKLSKKWMTFLLAATIGLLIFLGLDTLVEAVELSAEISSPFQGIGLAGIGAVGTFLLLDAISRRGTKTGRSEAEQRLTVATLIATGIGLHNLGEGLAIGAAFNIGEIALGTFLVVGFIIQNITEGLGIIAPVLRDRPGWIRLALMGLLGGAPAIFGAWLGGFAPSPILAVLFLGIGTGAIFEVVYEIAKMIRRDMERQPMPLTIFTGVAAGMLVLWVTGLLIK